MQRVGVNLVQAVLERPQAEKMRKGETEQT